MEINDTIQMLTKSPIYTAWNQEPGNYFLAHIFKMLDEPNANDFQFGFYSEHDEKMVTFIVSGDSVTKTAEQDVFRDESTKISPLQIDKIKIDWNDAIVNAKQVLADNYKNQLPIKIFLIVQTIPHGTVFNITFFTKSFHTVNVKISAEDGSIIDHKCTSVMDFVNFEKGNRKK